MRLAVAIALLLIPMAPADLEPHEADVFQMTPYKVNDTFGKHGDSVAQKDGHGWIIYKGEEEQPTFYVGHRDVDGTWDPPVEVGRAFDQHGYGDIVVDERGFLHIVYGGHVQPGFPIEYRKSIRPYDATAWHQPQVVTEGQNSAYPRFGFGYKDELVVVYRELGSQRGDVAMNWIDIFSGRVEPARSIVHEPGLAVYPGDVGFDRTGRMHLTWSIREDGTNPLEIGRPFRNIGYAVSRDQGETWKTVQGTNLGASFRASEVPAVDSGLRFDSNPLPRFLQRDGSVAIAYQLSKSWGLNAEGIYIAAWGATGLFGEAGWYQNVLPGWTTQAYSATNYERNDKWVIGTRGLEDSEAAMIYVSEDQGRTWEGITIAREPNITTNNGMYLMESGLGTVRGVIVGRDGNDSGATVDMHYFEYEL